MNEVESRAALRERARLNVYQCNGPAEFADQYHQPESGRCHLVQSAGIMVAWRDTLGDTYGMQKAHIYPGSGTSVKGWRHMEHSSGNGRRGGDAEESIREEQREQDESQRVE